MASPLHTVSRHGASADAGAPADGKDGERKDIPGGTNEGSTSGPTCESNMSNSMCSTLIQYSQAKWEVNSIPAEHRIKDPVQEKDKPANQKTYASFGDHGTTASVNAYGNIMQISRFLKFGRSGFLSVDLGGTPKPYFVQSRMDRLMEMSEESDEGIRLEIQKDCKPCWKPSTVKPCLEFVYDRWPRFTHTTTSETKNGLDFSLQYFCSRGIVFQTYTWKRRSENDPIPELPQFTFNPAMLIRDLDFVDPYNHFDTMDGYSRKTISSKTSLLVLHTKMSELQKRTDQEEALLGSPPTEDQSPVPESLSSSPGVIVAPFAYGKPQEIIPEDKRSYMYKIVLSQEAQNLFKDHGILEITMAYKIESRSAETAWEDATVKTEELEHMRKALSNTAYQRIAFSSHGHLDFVIRRNLEHILSVCSIPVSNGSGSEPENRRSATALTCGDITGHRITSSASFFAFQFLIAIFKYISDPSKAPKDYFSGHQECDDHCKQESNPCKACNKVAVYLQHLQQRIRLVCQGHILWVYEDAKTEKNGTFSPHYWATGECISGWDSNKYMTPGALTDTPFQVIKLQLLLDVKKLGGYQLHFQGAFESLESRFQAWIRRLEDDDDRGKFAFPRPSKDGNKVFYLADHFWIHQALKFAAEWNPRLLGPEISTAYVSEGLDPDELRESMIRKFTIVNPDTKRRTLATSRTFLETSFRFRSTDTALLYAMDEGFFEMPSERKARGAARLRSKALVEEWRNTLDIQAYYEENQTEEWESPLQYALAIIMGSKNQRINLNSAERVLSISKEVLLKSASSNGLFSGLLREKGEPTMFQHELDRDDYWHATFEIPYIIWTYGRDLFAISSKSEIGQSQKQSTDTGRTALMGAIPVLAEVEQTNDGQRPVSFLKNEVPFSNLNNVIDQKVLVEISDDWLLGGPSFLEFGSTPNALFINESAENDSQKQEDAGQGALQQSILQNANIQLATSKRSVESRGPDDKGLPSFLFDDEDTIDACETIRLAKDLYQENQHLCDKVLRGVVIDVPKGSDGEELKTGMMTNDKIFRRLAKRRRVQDAKKRLIWLRRGDKVTALTCYLASPKLERDNMSAFLDRHASYDKFFYDGVAPFQNEWETELHLSYFSLLDHDPGILKQDGTIPYLSYIMAEQPRNALNSHTEPAKPKTLARATMSFRFVGDFFDRYWTCHVLEFDAKIDSLPENLRMLLSTNRVPFIERTQKNRRKKHAWQQRKVLELLLFHQMLKRIKVSTRHILNWVRDEVSDTPKKDEDYLPVWWPLGVQGLERDEEPLFSEEFLKAFRARLSEEPFKLVSTYPLNPLAEALEGEIRSKQLKGSDGYFSKATLWRFFETILQTVEDDLEENLVKIEEWSRREEDRGLQNPRWTRNDERRYGSIIKTLRFQTRREIHELQRLKASIIAFREPRSSKLSTLRDDFSFRSSENINLFTYVTVVFLPLGFATGIFSMSDPPGTSALIGMVITSIVALYLTIGALVNAKSLRNLIVDPIIQLSHICGKKVFFYPVYFYLRYLYHPAANTSTGSAVSKWYKRLQDKTKKENVFQQAKKDYDSRNEKMKHKNQDDEIKSTKELQESSQSSSKSETAEDSQNGGSRSTRTTNSDSRTDDQRSSPPVDLENGRDV